jgi:hypothetical protein
VTDSSLVITFDRWRFTCDREATQKAYAATLVGGPEECGCTYCLNFAEQRSAICPEAMLNLFAKIGIEPNQEAEVYQMVRLESGRHLYGGWFHFIGSLLPGKDAVGKAAESLWASNLENVTEFSFKFTERADLALKPFEGLPLVQLEFLAKILRVINAEEPQ